MSRYVLFGEASQDTTPLESRTFFGASTEALAKLGYEIREDDSEEDGLPDPAGATEECSEEGCTEQVTGEDPHYATPCGTFCNEHMAVHTQACGICEKYMNPLFEVENEN